MQVKEKQNSMYLKDKYAVKLLKNENLRDYLIKILSRATELDEEYFKDLKQKDTKISKKIHYKNNEVDLLFEAKDAVFNIEINKDLYLTLRVKNNSYIFHLYLSQLEPGEKYKIPKKIYQINIDNYDRYKKGKFMYVTVPMEKDLHITDDDSSVTIDLNLEKLKLMSYDEIKKLPEDSLEKLLYVFACGNTEEIEEAYKGSNLLMKVVEEIRKMEQYDDILYYNKEELEETGAYEIGYERGAEQKMLENAKNMFKDKVPGELIMKYTGITKEQLEELKEEMKNG